jgi:Flp pilus assembly protein TadD
MLFKKAHQLENEGKNQEALDIYAQLINQEPNNFKHYNAAAVVLYKLSRFKDAAKLFEKTIMIEPKYAEAYSNLGAIHAKFKNFSYAIKCYQKSIELKPSYAGAYTNLGNSLNKSHEYEQAVYFHLQAISRDDTASNHFANCGSAYKNLGRFDKAEWMYKKALSLEPNHINAHFDLATVLLQVGKFKEGWEHYEWRMKKDEMRGHLKTYHDIFSKPLWCGEDLKAKRIMIHSEQGFGDSLQVARYFYNLKALGAYVIVYTRQGLEGLFEAMSCVDKVQVRGEEPEHFDYQLPMMSLAHCLDENLKNIIEHYPYLKAPKQRVLLPKRKKKIRIGLCWGASNTGESYDKKVLKLSGFEKILYHDDYEVISLQLGDDAQQQKSYHDRIIDVSEKMTDFSATASIIKQCDVIISSDTSVAHLAGAMGKPTWILLQKVPDWRWGVDSKESLWYPSVTLFRQYSLGSWHDVYERVFDELKNFEVNKNAN